MSQTKLLPCPFCGEPAEMDTYQNYRNISTGNMETGVAIYCVGCGVQAMLCRGDIPDLEPEMVVEIWNRRALSAPSPVVEGQGASTETERGDGSLPVPSQTQSPAGRSGPVWPKRGDKMVFMNRNGYDSEREAAAKVFEVGKPLTVIRCEVGSWSHSVWFDEDPTRGWNGVMFEMVGAPKRFPLPADHSPSDGAPGRQGNLAGDEPPSSPSPVEGGGELEYAQRLATVAASKFGPPPGWKPLGDMYGVLSQIDNCLTGLEAPTSPPQATNSEVERLRRAAKALLNNIDEFGTITDGEFLEDLRAALAQQGEKT